MPKDFTLSKRTYLHQVRELEKQNKKYGEFLEEVPRDKWPNLRGPHLPAQVFRSSKFIVQVFDPVNGATRLSINRTMIGRGGEWLENIRWDELQELKREAGFGAYWAVEIFPSQVGLVNVANMRHLWVLPTPPPFGWHSRPVSSDPTPTPQQQEPGE